jgi:phosphoribosylamine--glycine ligase
MAKENTPYRGVLYAGVMLTKSGPYVLEYNCRFGDPEAQAILPRLKSDLLPVLLQVARGSLSVDSLEWHEKSCISVVMASGGYPGFYHKGYVIEGIEKFQHQSATQKADPSFGGQEVFVFHAGTALDTNGHFITAGGRVLAVTALGENLRAAHDKAYEAINQIHFEGGFCRRDIGKRALEVLR